ncbi:MAG: response regulator transcription factor [Acidobacteria bacterium]|nr:response regulator transcription factor [Acidobacteriota bacterium]
MPATHTRVLVIDDDRGCFEQIKSQLQPEDDFVVGWRQTCCLQEVADEEFEQTDVVITDSDKQESNSLAESVSNIRSKFPFLEFLIVGTSGDDGDHVMMLLLQSGAKGYVDLNTSADKLASAVRRLAAGATWLPPHVLARYVDLMAIVESLPVYKTHPEPWSKFTSREERVMLLMACGRSDREIAQTLGVDQSIITSCLHQVMHRTGAPNRPTLIALYLYHKLFRSDFLTTLDQHQLN